MNPYYNNPLTGVLKQDISHFFTHHSKEETTAHSLEVARIARELASRFGVDPYIAEQAGLLHDIGDVIPYGEEIAFSQLHGMDVLPEEEEYPRILHQRHSVIMAQLVFGVVDPAVLSAIGCHTTLKAGASLLDKVVFLADKLSWDQAGESPFKEAVNAALSKSLDAACLAYMRWLLGPGGGVRVVHPWLKAALYDLKEMIGSVL